MNNQNDSIYNVLSPDFNPLKSLENVHLVKLPFPKILPLDNLHKARVLLPPNDPNYIQFNKKSTSSKPASSTITTTTTSNANKDSININQNKQIENVKELVTPITNNLSTTTSTTTTTTSSTTTTIIKPNHNILQSITSKFTEGPINLLKRCLESKKKVKVIIRDVKSIRGYCIGYLIAFDKHWNLILRDVDEEYIVIQYIDNELSDLQQQQQQQKKKKIIIKCQRHYGQLFIKGDTIVSVYSWERG
eukprot:gene7964-9797_t